MNADRDDRGEFTPLNSTVEVEAATAAPGDDGHSTVSWDISDAADALTRIGPDMAAGDDQPIRPTRPPAFGARYRSIRFHAKGGIGLVWKVLDGVLGRDVALKELRPEHAGNLSVEQRFRDEARITAGLEHPNIITLHDLSTDADHPFYTMRFVDGRTLKQAVVHHHQPEAGASQPTLDLRGLLDAFLNVCHALAFAHSKGVIHRDLKGQNIMLGPFGEVAVLDWGLARDLRSADDPLARPAVLLEDLPAEMSRTMEGAPIGTAQYMPPEQAAGRRELIGVRSDVFGLGAILYLILTGRPPYDGSSTAEMIRKAMNHEFPRPSAIRPGIPPALEAICLRAMAAKPEDRYETAAALSADVRRWMADEPVSAFPDGPVGVVARWARKHQPAVAGTTALLATATIALAASTWMISSAKQKAESAENETRVTFGVFAEVVPNVLEIVTGPGVAVSPELLDIRRKLVREVSIFAPRLTEFYPDNPLLCRLEARLVRLVAHLERLDARPGDASEHLARAVSLLRKLARDGPDPTGDAVRLADVLKEKGSLDAALGQFALAEEAYREALGLASPAPGTLLGREFERVCSWHQTRLSFVLRETGRPGPALAAAEAALRATTSLGTTLPGYKRDLAAAHAARGRSLADLGRRGEAQTAFDLEVRLAEEWVAETKGDTDATFVLAEALLDRANFLRSDPAARDRAVLDAKNSVPLIIKLRARYPEVSYYRRGQAYAKVVLGELLLELGRLDEAEALATEARDEMRPLADGSAGVVADQQIYGRALGLHGRIDRRRGRIAESRTCLDAAIARYTRVLDLNPGSPDDIAGKGRAEADR